SNKSVTINSPLFRIENCTFHGLCTAFMANLLGVVPIRSIMLKMTGFMKIIRIVQDGFSILHTYRLDI
ncbi:hypothetical protein, partial [Providencia rustigianii]|uniref:hypothetical protein n=1 Tax=Providencia rustigianii TaxID=158850 RepID=UPI00223EB5BD